VKSDAIPPVDPQSDRERATGASAAEPTPAAESRPVRREEASASAPARELPPDLPPRPVWNTVEPTAPWCPDEWRAHLDAIAPGLAAWGSHEAAREASGLRLDASGFTVVLTARRGRLHAHRGEHREDAGHIVAINQGWCAAVADGAGSAPWSRLGSAIATRVVTEALAEALLDGRAEPGALGPAMRHAAQLTNDRMRDFAARAGVAPRTLRTTLLVAALHQGRLAVMQVGDGAMTWRTTDGTIVHPHAAATGDYSGEVAHFLPDDGALDQLQQSVSQHDGNTVDTLILASDGVEDPWYPFTRHAGALMEQLIDGTAEDAAVPAGYVAAWRDSVLRAPDPVEALSAWLAFEKRGENDDRTLCVVHRTPS
jgi:serine/threonine protein phosphatase PrpC